MSQPDETPATITDLLADLEAKATQALIDGNPDHWPHEDEAVAVYRNGLSHRLVSTAQHNYIVLCSPDRILALVAQVRNLQKQLQVSQANLIRSEGDLGRQRKHG